VQLSVVVPLYNEEESVELLHRRIHEALQDSGLEYEILFVDDGSRDRTLEIAAAITARDPRLKVIEFRANYGQTPAMAAGLDHASGEVIATMDGDLQNDPRDIPAMFREMDERTDMVVGWRKNRQDKLLTRKVPSWVANRMIGAVTGVPIKDNGCSLKLYRASVIKHVPLYSEMHRFIPAMASITGARIKEVPVTHHARQFGQSKYGLSRIYRVLLDLMTIKTIIGFAQRPLLWFGLFASVFMLLSVIALAASVAPLLSAEGTLLLPFAGTGVLFAALSLFLLMGGAIGELIYATGDMDLSDYSKLLAVVQSGDSLRHGRVEEGADLGND
ncbi:MAG TPA: glycosyltransferase family 2 protein, partial [Gammaproteobacteria bacterium]|nr:glycosyltransferase family 2 protein [Gammaproteobacteria bacterium]